MIVGVQPREVLVALSQRLETVAVEFGLDTAELSDAPEERAASLLVELPGRLNARPGPDVWLYLVAVLGRFPVAVEVENAARVLELDGPEVLVAHVLDLGKRTVMSVRADLKMELVTDRVVISADYCSREDNHTGVQRVTRAIARRWRENYGAVAVADIDERMGFRNLAPREEARVYRYGADTLVEPADELAYRQRLVVPYRTTVLFPEVMHWDSSPALAGLAAYSGNATVGVGHDTIPILSSSMRPAGDPGDFTRYLSVVKHMTKVAAVSASAANEFQGFVDMLVAQGLDGPTVSPIPLATEVDGLIRPASSRSVGDPPLVVIPARLELHKNVLTAVQAAHRLWQEGLDFELVLLGGAGAGQEVVLEAVAAIQDEGRPIRRLGWVSDEVMWQMFADAAFVVFVSLHEGFGLPLVEAMSCGAPVLTSNFGSQAEIAEGGGCLTVDPRSLTEVADGMRELITRPQRRCELASELAQRPVRTWDDYAAEVWSSLVGSNSGGVA